MIKARAGQSAHASSGSDAIVHHMRASVRRVALAIAVGGAAQMIARESCKRAHARGATTLPSEPRFAGRARIAMLIVNGAKRRAWFFIDTTLREHRAVE